MSEEKFARMRHYWPFYDEQSFEHLFGMRNGTRMNKILLAFITSEDVYNIDPYLAGTTNMQNMKRYCMDYLRREGGNLLLNGWWYGLSGYRTDDRCGICSDGDTGAVRFIHDGRVAKMRVGKLFSKILQESDTCKNLPDSVKTWLTEEFSSEWRAFVEQETGAAYNLVTGLDGNLTFADIYGNGNTYRVGHFGSCMEGQERHKFYDVSMKDVYPAALVSKDDPNLIVARCVVYNHVEDVDTGDVYRLAERQYTDDGDAVKRQLVNKLEKAGLIDGHKAVGASCHDGWNFVANDGTSLREKKLSVDVDFKDNKVLSYQDSFKYYDNDRKKAYNFCPDRYSLDLATTSPRVSIYFDSYHNREVFNGVYAVWVNGIEMTCDEQYMEDFTYWNGAWYHTEKDTVICPHCGTRIGAHHIPKGYYSELTGEHYCGYECKRQAETAIKERSKFYSVFDNEFVDKASELTNVFVYVYNYSYGYNYGYKFMSIKKTTLEAAILLGNAAKYRGKYYVVVDSKKKPLGVATDGKPKMWKV